MYQGTHKAKLLCASPRYTRGHRNYSHNHLSAWHARVHAICLKHVRTTGTSTRQALSSRVLSTCARSRQPTAGSLQRVACRCTTPHAPSCSACACRTARTPRATGRAAASAAEPTPTPGRCPLADALSRRCRKAVTTRFTSLAERPEAPSCGDCCAMTFSHWARIDPSRTILSPSGSLC